MSNANAKTVKYAHGFGNPKMADEVELLALFFLFILAFAFALRLRASANTSSLLRSRYL